MSLRVVCVGTCVLSTMLMLACSDSGAPLQPSGSLSSGSGLKVGAPTKMSPLNGVTLSTRNPVLSIRSAAGLYGTPAVSYEFQVTTTAGDTVFSGTAAGGPADGTSPVSITVAPSLPPKGEFRWRARAVVGSVAGPWSDSATTGSANFVTSQLTASSTNAEFHDFFFSLIAQKGVGNVPTQQAFQIMEPDLTAVGIIVAKDSSGSIRGRIYLPTGGADKFARSVDVITGFGGSNSWAWNERGATKCEGICP